jgi:hypothetical protein
MKSDDGGATFSGITCTLCLAKIRRIVPQREEKTAWPSHFDRLQVQSLAMDAAGAVMGSRKIKLQLKDRRAGRGIYKKNPWSYLCWLERVRVLQESLCRMMQLLIAAVAWFYCTFQNVRISTYEQYGNRIAYRWVKITCRYDHFILSIINGSTALYWALGSSSVS